MVPNISFRYSHIYNQNWKDWITLYKPQPRQHIKDPDRHVKLLIKYWSSHSRDILVEMALITGIAWKEKEIICYIVDDAVPFSDPLTMKLYFDKDEFLDILTHELIHRLFVQDQGKRTAKAWARLQKKYGKDIHILLNSVHAILALKLFGKKRLVSIIRRDSKIHRLARAWEISQKHGFDKIVSSFRQYN